MGWKKQTHEQKCAKLTAFQARIRYSPREKKYEYRNVRLTVFVLGGGAKKFQLIRTLNSNWYLVYIVLCPAGCSRFGVNIRM